MAAAVGKVENNALGLSSKNKTKGRRRNARKFTKKNKIMEQIKKQIKNVKKNRKIINYYLVCYYYTRNNGGWLKGSHLNKVIIGFHFLVYNFRNSCEFSSETKHLGRQREILCFNDHFLCVLRVYFFRSAFDHTCVCICLKLLTAVGLSYLLQPNGRTQMDRVFRSLARLKQFPPSLLLTSP